MRQSDPIVALSDCKYMPALDGMIDVESSKVQADGDDPRNKSPGGHVGDPGNSVRQKPRAVAPQA